MSKLWTAEEVKEFAKTGIVPNSQRPMFGLSGANLRPKTNLLTSVTITIPLPPIATHQNARPYWKTKAKATRQQRHNARYAAIDVWCRPSNQSDFPRWKYAEVQATFYLSRSQDSSNLAAWLKATWDGLQDAGIIENDSGLTVLPPIQITGKAAKGQRKVVLTITRKEPT